MCLRIEGLGYFAVRRMTVLVILIVLCVEYLENETWQLLEIAVGACGLTIAITIVLYSCVYFGKSLEKLQSSVVDCSTYIRAIHRIPSLYCIHAGGDAEMSSHM